ncbi:UNVERIFIED_ORG: Ca2+-binding RTX toxin-like protein [Arthrobacter globiformis]|nr:Ca2+-binding RTX toxin-like protein [Arthrobacter globiformis]
MNTYQIAPGTSPEAGQRRKRNGRRRILAGLSVGFLTGAFLVATAPAAQAASGVRVSGSTLLVQMSSERSHDITVSQIDIPSRGVHYQVREVGGGLLLAGSGCFNASVYIVRCPRAPIASLNATGGVLNDTVVVNATFRSLFQTVISGNAGRDRITGSLGRDIISGGGGDDVINGRDGNDTLYGDANNDTILDGRGTDTIRGGTGHDHWSAEAARDVGDTFEGGTGTDTADYDRRSLGVNLSLNNRRDDGAPGEADYLRADVEQIFGGEGKDVLTGDDNANRIYGGGEADIIDGRGGDDDLDGLRGDDTVTGGSGADVIGGGYGNDRLFGTDSVIGNDKLDGWADTDTCRADRGDTKTRCES